MLESVRRSLGLQPADFGEARPVGGGCINHGVRLATGAGDFFLKWNSRADERFFRIEAEGLAALAG
ncbi:MAG: fructosamine kinase family protein, partial [Gemmatimonadetes bacterium]|nr:fructosamine kinase family protein [Gemmatimonadota bacterium]